MKRNAVRFKNKSPPARVTDLLCRLCEFLDKNKNYSAVYGDAGIYSIYKNRLFINHIFRNKLNLKSNDIQKRLNTYFLNYSPKLYYSLMRTKLFKKNLDLWKMSKKKYGDKFQRFAEIHLPLTLLLSGKVGTLNKIFCCLCLTSNFSKISMIFIFS